MLLDKTIRLFLDGIGRREEYEFYLRKFQAGDRPAFALVGPDAESLEAATDVLLFDLQFLLKVGLVPVIVLAGEAATAQADSLRRLEKDCSLRTVEKEDEIGRHVAWIRRTAARRRVPVLAFSCQLEEALCRLSPAVARRIHLVRTPGALRTVTGEPVYHYYSRRPTERPLHPDDEELARVCRTLAETIESVHLSVTSPMNLLRELFTVKGAGTVVRRGSTFLHLRRRTEIDETRLIRLLEDSFGRQVADTSFLDATADFYIESSYRAAALVEPHPAGSYLSKFAVGAEARGEGVAQELWREVVSRHARMFWRSRTGNPINQWYKKNADGRHTVGDWIVFWRGISPADIPLVIDACLQRPHDFRDRS